MLASRSAGLASGFVTQQAWLRPDTALFRQTQTISGRFSNLATGAWPDIIPVALRSNLKPFVLLQPYSLFVINYQSRSDGNFSPAMSAVGRAKCLRLSAANLLILWGRTLKQGTETLLRFHWKQVFNSHLLKHLTLNLVSGAVDDSGRFVTAHGIHHCS